MPSLATLKSAAPYIAQGVGGLLNRNAVGNATKTLTAGANTAIDTINEGARTSRKSMADIWDAQQKLLDPYTSAGAPATKRLSEGVATGGDLVKPFGNTEFELYKDPSYQWRIEQGNREIKAGANAGGIRFSAATLKALSSYNQSEGSKEWAAADQRFQRDQQNEFDRNLGVSNIGQNATNTEVQAGSNYSTNLAKVDQATAASMADLQTDLASAQAAGDVAKANSITDTINGILKTAESAKLAKSLAGAAPAALAGTAAGTAGGATALTSAIPSLASTAGLTATGGASATAGLSAAAPSLAAAAPGAAGATGITGALGLGGGSGILGLGAATIPVIGGIIAGGLLVNKYLVGQGRKQADKLTGEGGIQHSFEQALATIDKSGQTPEQNWQSKTQAYEELKKLGLEFASNGKNQYKTASQMFDTISHLFGEPNPLKGAA